MYIFFFFYQYYRFVCLGIQPRSLYCHLLRIDITLIPNPYAREERSHYTEQVLPAQEARSFDLLVVGTVYTRSDVLDT